MLLQTNASIMQNGRFQLPNAANNMEHVWEPEIKKEFPKVKKYNFPTEFPSQTQLADFSQTQWIDLSMEVVNEAPVPDLPRP
jgi:hypothetical protein